MISIIVPVYNVEKYLKRCLDSCFYQNYKDMEVVAVNDGSTDSSGELLDQYAIDEPRLKVIHQNNCGLQKTRNTGLSNASGDFVFYLDSDDYLPDNSVISVMVDEQLKSNADIVVGRINIDNEKKVFMFPSDVFDIIDSETYCKKYLLCGRVSWNICGKLFRSKLLKEFVPPLLSVTAAEDALFMITLSHSSNLTVSMTNKPVYNYLQRCGSITNTKNKNYIYDNFKVADYIENSLKGGDIEDKYLVAFRLLCMSASFRYGWLGSENDLNKTAIEKYKSTKGVLSLFAFKKRVQIWMLIYFSDIFSMFYFGAKSV